DEFKRQALAFKDHWEAKGADVEMHFVTFKKGWKKHNLVLDAIEHHEGPIDVLALFCHGWKSGISLGFRNWHIGDLVGALREKGPRWTNVILYACSTMGKRNAFGHRLARELNTNGYMGDVVGHSTKGHCTRNPFVWVAGESSGGEPWLPCIGLGWRKRRKSPQWKAWVKRLQGPEQYDFWE
ncbi:MAG: hypothetical protein ACYS76_15480, partial [Planctomycetota bacterium]